MASESDSQLMGINPSGKIAHAYCGHVPMKPTKEKIYYKRPVATEPLYLPAVLSRGAPGKPFSLVKIPYTTTIEIVSRLLWIPPAEAFYLGGVLRGHSMSAVYFGY